MSTRFCRSTPKRKYRTLFLISTEGSVTEPEYFDLFNNQHIHVVCLTDVPLSSPTHVLSRMKQKLDKVALRNGDEVWLVVDKDRWTDEQLFELHQWAQEPQKGDAVERGLAVSNPRFEYWLLLHCEDSAAFSTKCFERHFPEYDKSIAPYPEHFHDASIRAAIERAERLDTPNCPDWPRQHGTTVYRLVKRLFNKRNET